MIDMKIQKLRCNIHNRVVHLNSLIDARHNHGLNTDDEAGYVREIGALVGYLLHAQSAITEFNFEDHLTEVCPDLIRAERTEARVFYSLVFQLMKTQSLLFYRRYTASAIEGVSCFDVIMDGSVNKTDRLDPFKLTAVANSAISLVHYVRDQIRSLTRDIVFPRGKPIANIQSQARVLVKAEHPIATEGDAKVGDNDDTMGADYDVEPGNDDTQIPGSMGSMIIEDENAVDSSLVHMYGASFNLPFAKQACNTALTAVQESANFSALKAKRV